MSEGRDTVERPDSSLAQSLEIVCGKEGDMPESVFALPVSVEQIAAAIRQMSLRDWKSLLELNPEPLNPEPLNPEPLEP